MSRAVPLSGPIDQTVFTIFDTETTGLNPAAGDRIIELAAVKFRGSDMLGKFDTLVDPQREISPQAYAVNRISSCMLKGAPQASHVLEPFIEFIEGSCVCSYNMPFDLGFLNAELARAGMEPFGDRVAIDILTMARKLLPHLQRHALWFVAEHLQVSAGQQHRALADVEMTREVFSRLNRMLEEKKITDFGKLFRLCGVRSRMLADLHEQKAAEIQQAIDAAARITIEYLSSASGAVSRRQIIPKEISGYGANRYVAGWCCLRNEERIFRLDHILEVELA